MEAIRTMEWVDDALQSWMANDLVKVPQTMIITSQSSPIVEPDITTKLQPYLDSQATLDWLMARAYSKTLMTDINRNQLQPNNTDNKHRTLQWNNVARNKAIQNGEAQKKHSLSTNTDRKRRW